MTKKYVLKLSADERGTLSQVIRKGKSAAWKVQRRCGAGPEGPAWTDAKIAEAYGVTTWRLESWRKRAVEEGPLSLLGGKKTGQV